MIKYLTLGVVAYFQNDFSQKALDYQIHAQIQLLQILAPDVAKAVGSVSKVPLHL